MSFLLGGCATTKQPSLKVETAVQTQAAVARVEKVREPLEVTPLELFFAGLRGSTTASESVSVKNASSDPVQVSELRIVGPHADTFKITDVPIFPALLASKASLTFTVEFAPPANAEAGVHHARVRIVRNEDEDGPPCDLTGLVTKGIDVKSEPPLQQILEALGYAVDVGSPNLILPGGSALAGDEVKSPLFAQAKPGSVGYYLIARYTANEDSSFGYYLLDNRKPLTKGIGKATKGHNQTLNPEIEGDAQTSFDPGDSVFGIYLRVGKRNLYSEDTLNSGANRHVARVYPLRSRGHTLVQDAYVVAFDEDGNNDYQDHVFMLWNVKPAK